jgi:hypothetical protein
MAGPLDVDIQVGAADGQPSMVLYASGKLDVSDAWGAKSLGMDPDTLLLHFGGGHATVHPQHFVRGEWYADDVQRILDIVMGALVLRILAGTD